VGADALTLAFEGLAARTDGSPLAVLVAVLAARSGGHSHDHPHPAREDGDGVLPVRPVGRWRAALGGHGRGDGHRHPHGHPHRHASPAAGERTERAAIGTLECTETVTEAPTHSDHADPVHGHPHRAASSPRGLVAMGLAGGLLPGPSALVVFLAAAVLGTHGSGWRWVVAFGVGMASTMAVVGLLVVRLRDRAAARVRPGGGRLLGSVPQVAPLLTAAVVTLLGVTLAVRGLTGTGLL